jgi:hypothetical protein
MKAVLHGKTQQDFFQHLN